MSVVGLDFGNLSVLIGQAGRGGVDVILNDSSNRQTASYVSIQGKQRFLGDSGSAMVSIEDDEYVNYDDDNYLRKLPQLGSE